MRDIKAAALEGNERAQLAIDVFCYRIRKYIGAYAAALGGLDAVVFTAGVAENNAFIRADCVEGLEFTGIELDHALNDANPRVKEPMDISTPDASARVLVHRPAVLPPFHRD